MIYEGSRYENNRTIHPRLTRNGTTRTFPVVYDFGDLPDYEIAEIYETTEGDQLDELAYRFGGDGNLWWVIARINNITTNPLNMAGGISLNIPTRDFFKSLGA